MFYHVGFSLSMYFPTLDAEIGDYPWAERFDGWPL
jgi:hypothetical protein